MRGGLCGLSRSPDVRALKIGERLPTDRACLPPPGPVLEIHDSDVSHSMDVLAVRRCVRISTYGSRLPVVLGLLEHHVTNRQDSSGRIDEC